MVRGDAGAAPGMVNEERTVVGYVFGKGLKWEIATKNPVKQTEKWAAPDGIPRPLTRDEEERLIGDLPAHYTPFVTSALHTGLRLGELRALGRLQESASARTPPCPSGKPVHQAVRVVV